MFNKTIVDTKLIRSWKQETCPSDIVADPFSPNKWLVLGSKDTYWEFSLEKKAAIAHTTTAELYRVEASKDDFLFLLYNTITRENEAWKATSLDRQDEVKLTINDPATIAYSPATKQLYWSTHSKEMMVYNMATKGSSTVDLDYAVAECLISENGRFLALRDTDSNYFVWDLVAHTLVVSKKQEAGKYYSLVGATNEGALVVCTQSIARKNKQNSTNKHQVLCILKEKVEVLLEGKIDWARLVGKHLATWEAGELSIHQVAS